MTRVYIFPGQGSQRVGMGRNLWERFPTLVEAASTSLGYCIKELCTDHSGRLDQTEFTQPAVYVVNALSLFEREALGKLADYAAGHSLGEYSALLAAGAFDFITGLRLVQKRGQLMGRLGGGAMAAVSGLSEEQLRCELERGEFVALDIANYNSPRQWVLSGPRHEIERARAELPRACEVEIKILPVSGAFHSRYMLPSCSEFLSFAKGFTFAPLRIPVLSNAYAERYEDVSVAETLAAQIASPVRWTEIASQLLALENAEIEELGTGRVLSALIRQLRTHRLESAQLGSARQDLEIRTEEATCRF